MNENKLPGHFIARLGYFRNLRNFSAREVSLRLGYSESWFYRVEAGQIDINCSTFFNILELLDITASEFFYYDPEKLSEDKELNYLIPKLSKDDKKAICQLLSKR